MQACINSINSNAAGVSSSVLQGIFLEPILFLLYVNDLASTLLDCHICFHVDNIKFFKQIMNAHDI